MRWRLYERRASSNICCFCCHVRTGTICLGIYSLLNELVAIGVTLALAINPELAARQFDDLASYYPDYYTASHGNNVTSNETVWTSTRTLSADGRVVELVLNIGYAMFTISLLYGVVRGYAKFLLPFFCLQVFEFCIHCLIVVGYFTYEPNIKMWIASWKWFPLHDSLLTLNTGWLMLIFGLVAILYLWIKAYFISVVWSCYKYLIQTSLTLPVSSQPTCELSLDYLGARGSGSSSSGVVGPAPTEELRNPADSQILLPPKYEDVLQMSDPADCLSPPPPPYSAALTLSTAASPPPS